MGFPRRPNLNQRTQSKYWEQTPTNPSNGKGLCPLTGAPRVCGLPTSMAAIPTTCPQQQASALERKKGWQLWTELGSSGASKIPSSPPRASVLPICLHSVEYSDGNVTKSQSWFRAKACSGPSSWLQYRLIQSSVLFSLRASSTSCLLTYPNENNPLQTLGLGTAIGKGPCFLVGQGNMMVFFSCGRHQFSQQEP